MTRRSILKSIFPAAILATLFPKLARAAKPVTIVVTVATAGTPVQVSSTNIQCNTISFCSLGGNSGANCYVGGTSSFSKTTGAGLIMVVPKGLGGSLASQYASNPFNLADYWIDADTSGDKVSVTYWQI